MAVRRWPRGGRVHAAHLGLVCSSRVCSNSFAQVAFAALRVCLVMSLFSRPACVLAACGAVASARHTRVDVRLEASPAIADTQSASGAGFLSVAPAAVAAGELDRETQAPMVWLNLHKPVAGATSAGFVSVVDPALGDAAGIFEHAPVQTFEARKDVVATSAVMRGLGSQPASASPMVRRVVDPPRHHAMAACDRDFSQPCPAQFQLIDAGKCAPAAGYEGPCGGSHGFGGLSPAAKSRWSEMCYAWWPCVQCERDFGGVCPEGWVRDVGAVCKPAPAYTGPCGEPTDFAGYTREMLAQWAASCDAHWPCATGAGTEVH